MDDNNANNKKCNSTLTKRNSYDDFMGAIIGLATVASVLVFIYLCTYLIEKHQNTPRNSLVFLYDSYKWLKILTNMQINELIACI